MNSYTREQLYCINELFSDTRTFLYKFFDTHVAIDEHVNYKYNSGIIKIEQASEYFFEQLFSI
jgi:hypothetical protein